MKKFPLEVTRHPRQTINKKFALKVTRHSRQIKRDLITRPKRNERILLQRLEVGQKHYLPALVTIISVPKSWNSCHKHFISRLIMMLDNFLSVIIVDEVDEGSTMRSFLRKHKKRRNKTKSELEAEKRKNRLRSLLLDSKTENEVLKTANILFTHDFVCLKESERRRNRDPMKWEDVWLRRVSNKKTI